MNKYSAKYEYPEPKIQRDEKTNGYIVSDGQIQRGTFATFEEAQDAKAEWDKKIEEQRKIDAERERQQQEFRRIRKSFQNQYEKKPAMRRLRRRENRKEREGWLSTKEIEKRDGLEGFQPSQPTLKATEKGQFILATPGEIKARHLKWQKEAEDYRRANKNREKSSKAAKASTDQKNNRRDEARKLWRELRAKGVPETRRRETICAQLSISKETLRRYLKNKN